jgi:hypothetical protein
MAKRTPLFLAFAIGVASGALGRREPRNGVIDVAGPSDLSVVISHLPIDKGDPVEAGSLIAVLDKASVRKATRGGADARQARTRPQPQEPGSHFRFRERCPRAGRRRGAAPEPMRRNAGRRRGPGSLSGLGELDRRDPGDLVAQAAAAESCMSFAVDPI